MIRFTRHGVYVDRALVQSFLNIFFEDPRVPEAVICVAPAREELKIYSHAPHAPA